MHCTGFLSYHASFLRSYFQPTKPLMVIHQPDLTSLFNAYKPARSLRSSGQLRLQVPDLKKCTYGQRSFSFYATKPWNNLPFYVKQRERSDFKKNLKHFFFVIVFNLVIYFNNCMFWLLLEPWPQVTNLSMLRCLHRTHRDSTWRSKTNRCDLYNL